ncbi:MAG: SCP2 sterol-binding domain-containing protein [Actinomycetota bacterium]|nr:SCP2 sterol-binding domain-containing protein [Actinomycetota bacterium]
MAQFAFLSDEWIDAAREIRAEYHGRAPAIPVSVRMNQVVRDVPFGTGTIEAHLDTSSGEIELETGHLDKPDLTITLDYATAKAILVDGDGQAAMQAFMGGRIKVDGDITKMIALQTTGALGDNEPVVGEIFGRIRDITA